VASAFVEAQLLADYRSLVSPTWLRTSAAEEHEARLDELPGVITEVSPDDVMYQTDERHYFYWGRAAIRAICWVLAGLDRREPESILDLPSGHGRVLRALKAVFPGAALAACDIDHGAVDFCSEVFGAHPIYASESPRETVIGDRFDLIWCGSLITHLNEKRSRDLLEVLAGSLTPSGVLVFTTHGPHYRSLIADGAMAFPIGSTEDLLAEYDRCGFGFQEYTNAIDYGISICSPSWVVGAVEAVQGLGLDCYAARGWNGLHDVYGCTSREVRR
jgi:SAM-dependent methyltransferase